MREERKIRKPHDSTRWYITDQGVAADVFYIISTETGDYTLPDGEVCRYADTYNRESQKHPALLTLLTP